MNIDQSQLRPLQREHYLPPHQRHAWSPTGPGLLSPDRCHKCGTTSSSVLAGVAPRLCPVVFAGPPALVCDWSTGAPRALRYPGGLTVRTD